MRRLLWRGRRGRELWLVFRLDRACDVVGILLAIDGLRAISGRLMISLRVSVDRRGSIHYWRAAQQIGHRPAAYRASAREFLQKYVDHAERDRPVVTLPPKNVSQD